VSLLANSLAEVTFCLLLLFVVLVVSCHNLAGIKKNLGIIAQQGTTQTTTGEDE
jgi:hypothetical protein